MEYLFLISRILYGGFFLKAGLGHLTGLNGMSQYAAGRGVPNAKFMVAVSGLMIILGGLGIVLGVYVNLSVLLIILFLLPVTFIMHSYWKDNDPAMKMGNKVNFEKNLALLGAALAYLFISAPWPLSL